MRRVTWVLSILCLLSFCLGQDNVPPGTDLGINPIQVLTDLQGLDINSYLGEVVMTVKQNWYGDIPREAKSPQFEVGFVAIEFQIQRDGTVAGMRLAPSSGHTELDHAAFASILKSVFAPLPAEFKADYLRLRFKFSYNSDRASQDELRRWKDYGPKLPFPASSSARAAQQRDDFHADTPAQSNVGDIVPGRLVYRPEAKYPDEAEKEKLEGIVELQATIDVDGKVGELAIISGNVVLADAAVDAVRGWKFEPYTQKGQAVKVKQKLVFNFTQSKKVAELDLQLPPATLTGPLDPTRRAPFQEQVFAVGHGVSAPKPTYAPDPPYDEKAKKAKYQGTCLLSLIIGADGQAHDIRVIRALGEGLDVKAVETIGTWKFEPGTKDGKPVAVYAVIEVAFHVY
jgi:TonB family protein